MNRNDDSALDRLRRMATSDEMQVGRGRSEQLAHRAMARASSRPRRRAFAAALAGTAFAVVSVTSLGAIADQAAPGDALYVIDRAYESLGRVVTGPVDRSEETMVEALKLLDRGEGQAAREHLATELLVIDVAEAEPSDVSPPPAGSQETAEAAIAPPTTAREATSETQPIASEPIDSSAAVEPVEDAEDPLKLALEYALAAKQAARDSDDEAVTAEADIAMRSVLQLAIAPSDTAGAVVGEDTETVAASETSTTTTTVTEEPRRGNGGSGSRNTTTSTTTTSVPGEDLSTTGSDDGESSTGDDPGDSRQGAGGSTEPGDGGPDTGPLILPIP